MNIEEKIEELKNIIKGIDWTQFHFLRPKALYLFFVLAFIVLLLIIGNKERKKWKTMIAAPLRKYMFTKSSPWAIILPLLLFILGTSLGIIGLAGPTWKKKQIPGEKIQAVVLIALDLSESMLAKDIEPSRLERAKFKISDFVDANPRARAGLVAFAGTAHPVLPFTSDYKIIKHHAQSLANREMPVQGTNMQILLQIVDTMMQRVIAPSTILLMTDAISSDDAILLSNYINGSVHRLEVLLLSTPNGAPVPGHTSVVSKQDPTVLANLQQNDKIGITPITLDKSDVEGIAKRISDKLVFEKDKKEDEKDWDDMGWLLILPMLVIAAFWFRKGWVIQWSWIPLACLLFSSCGLKSKHPDWWYTKDYQGQLYADAKDYADAADAFDDNTQKAVAYFKAGDYQTAAELFEMDSSATGQYNRGLALAKMGRYEEAETIFEKAATLDPSLRDKANSSISKAKKEKMKVDSLVKFDPNKKTKQVAENKKKAKKDPLKERKAASKDEELSSDTQVKNMPKFGNRVTDEVQSNVHKYKEATFPPKDFKLQKPESTSEKILMQKTNADPGEFLHRRFEIQKMRYYKNVKPGKESW
jgi:Ca-activated chloride channel family protein